jgi:hypothetical protein
MRSLLLVLLLSSTCFAGICGRPCSPWLPILFPSECHTMETDPCVHLVMDAITERGVGNMAHLSQTGSSGGVDGSWISGSSSFIGGDFGFGAGGSGGIGGGWNGPGTKPGGPTGGLPNGDGSGGSEIPSKPIPEPGSLIVWLIIAILFVVRKLWRLYCGPTDPNDELPGWHVTACSSPSNGPVAC